MAGGFPSSSFPLSGFSVAMSFRLTLRRFPGNAQEKDQLGLPWGCVVEPLVSTAVTAAVNIEEVARCESCFAYINPYVRIARGKWTCSLCHATNDLPGRYRVTEEALHRLAEMNLSSVEYEAEPTEEEPVVDERALYLAVVDLTGGSEYLEAVKKALLASLEALSPSTYFALATFSDRLGLFDLHSVVPHVLHLVLPASGETSMGLEEITPLNLLGVPVGTNSDNITVAIESLRPVDSTPAPLSTADAHKGGVKRAFGSVVQLLVEYFGLYEDCASPRLLLFLAGLPNYGQGVLQPRYSIEKKGNEKELLQAQTGFYKDQAQRAAEIGLAMDLFILSSEYVDLASLKFLSLLTGGNTMYYSTFTDVQLPQDVYRTLSVPHGSHGLLRLRTSPEFKVARFYGHLFADTRFDNLYHVAGCDVFKSFGFDFEFTGSSGFDETLTRPTLQLAFAYTGPSRTGGRPVRLLRVQTLQVEAATTPADLYASADAETVLSVLTHKIIRASLEEGLSEGRLLLQDWLIILLAHYNEKMREGYEVAAVDYYFSKTPALQHLARLVFALLSSPLLQQDNVHPDERVFLQSLYSSLSPPGLVRALYPVLSAHADLMDVGRLHLPLSRQAVVTNGAPFFVLDAFHLIIVYYTPQAGAAPFPPPTDSYLRKMINEMKYARPVAPRIIFARQGSSEARYFDSSLIEDGVDGKQSYTRFMEFVAAEVSSFLASP